MRFGLIVYMCMCGVYLIVSDVIVLMRLVFVVLYVVVLGDGCDVLMFVMNSIMLFVDCGCMIVFMCCVSCSGVIRFSCMIDLVKCGDVLVVSVNGELFVLLMSMLRLLVML